MLSGVEARFIDRNTSTLPLMTHFENAQFLLVILQQDGTLITLIGYDKIKIKANKILKNHNHPRHLRSIGNITC
jgi:hypothetical protein